jgi:hypothetical protein
MICVAKNLSLRHKMRRPLELNKNKQERELTMAAPPKSNSFAFIVMVTVVT